MTEATRSEDGGLAWRPFVRWINLFALPLTAAAAGLAAAFGGLHGALSALAGAALLLADVHALAWIVAGALGGRMARRALVYAVVPFKFVVLVGLVYGAILVLGLDPMAFAGGITAVVTAILAATVRRAAG